MCGRFSNRYSWRELYELYMLTAGVPAFNSEPRYNAAPTQRLPVIRQSDGIRRADLMSWGLIPSWAKDRKRAASLINARAETVAEKPSFRSAYRQRRCIVPADGWYEWRAEGTAKQPYHFTLASGAPFAFAGLWEIWTEPESKERVESFCLITTEPNAMAATIHDRMPVVLLAAQWDGWLAQPSAGDLQSSLRPYAGDDLAVHPVSREALADVRGNRPECVVPLAPRAASA